MRGEAPTIALAAVLALPAVSGATMWHVPSQCPTIQAGIDSASAGDTVLVACGTYYEHDIVMKSGVCLSSETGEPACVTIDAQQQSRVLLCDSLDAAAIVDGFTLTRGWALGEYPNTGGGIWCANSSLAIVDCALVDNWAPGGGGGMYCKDSSPTMTRCTFSDNVGLVVGGGMYCLGSSPSLLDCTFSGNRAEVSDIFDGSGGGMFCGGGCAPTLTSCMFSANTAALCGGAVTSVSNGSSPSPVFISCIFCGNSADCGGALACGHSSVTITNCTFCNNSAYEGGAIHCASSSPIIENTIIASSVSGEAVYGGLSNPAMSCCDVYGNSGGDWVGCIEGQLGVNGNISDDPEFCNPPDGNYGVGPGSPCLAANNACGVLIGAWAESCTEAEAVRLQPVTWTAVKSRYR